MLRPVLSSAMIVTLVAGCATDTPFMPPPEELEPYGPVYVPDVPTPIVDGFELMQLDGAALSPVAAVDPEHRLYLASIDPDTLWPTVGTAEGARRPLPGRDGEASVVALRATNDARLHIVFAVGGEVRYTRMSSAGEFEAVQTLAQGDAREPNFAVGPTGEIVVGWTQFYEVGDDGMRPNPEVFVRVGTPTAERVEFGSPTSLNADCCGEVEDQVYAMSGPSIAIDGDGGVHAVYEWSAFGRTVIDYVRPSGDGYAAPVVVSEAAFSPCPALVIDAEGVAHVSFIRDLETGVFYARIVDGEVLPATMVYEPEDGRATLALLALDRDGGVHLGVTESGERRRIVYVHADEPAHVIHEQASGRVELTPRAGGMLVAPDGKLLFAFRAVYDESETAHIAMGR